MVVRAGRKKHAQEALLYPSVKWPGAWIPRRLIDRYQPTAQHRPETAAARATKMKNVRYPPTNGAQLETITFEPLGRLGKEVKHVVEAMAADAATMRGDRTAAPAAGRRIIHALEYTLITVVTGVLATAAGSCGMQAWERRANPRLGRLIGRTRKRNLTYARRATTYCSPRASAI